MIANMRFYGDDGMSAGEFLDKFLENKNSKFDRMSKAYMNEYLENKVKNMALKIVKDIDEDCPYRMLGTPIDASKLDFYAKLNKSFMTAPIDEILFFKKTEENEGINYHIFKTEDYFNEYVALGEKYPHISEMKFLDLNEEDIDILKGE